jgi:hypothetical protein
MQYQPKKPNTPDIKNATDKWQSGKSGKSSGTLRN